MAPTNAELQSEVDQLRGQLAEAQAAAASAEQRAAAAEDRATVLPNTRPKPEEPTFGMSEGQRAELELHGKTVSPFTGARQVGSGKPGERPRVVDAETFDKIKPKSATKKAATGQ